jgi:hypothetical protein
MLAKAVEELKASNDLLVKENKQANSNLKQQRQSMSNLQVKSNEEK